MSDHMVISDSRRRTLLLQLAELQSQGLTQADILRYLGEQVPELIYGPYIEQVRASVQSLLGDEGQVDERPLVSRGEDPGVWVNMWVWIYDSAVGVEECLD